MTPKIDDLIKGMTELFGDAESMEAMDASEFVDNASEIWRLRQLTQEILEERK